MSLAAIYGLGAWALLFATLFSWRCGASRRLPLAAALAVLALLPVFDGLSVAMALHGALSLPSATLLQLALLRLARPAAPSPLRGGAAWLLAAVGVVFYPLALGLGGVDPYGLGFRPLPLLFALLLAAAWCSRRQPVWLVILGVDLLAYAAGVFPNLWDALIDPFVVLLALYRLSRPGLRG